MRLKFMIKPGTAIGKHEQFAFLECANVRSEIPQDVLSAGASEFICGGSKKNHTSKTFGFSMSGYHGSTDIQTGVFLERLVPVE